MTDRTEVISVQVVHQVANTTAEDVSDMPPLYSAIDPDALDQLVANMTDGEISFTYAGRTVTVSSDGTIAIEERPAEETATEMAVSDD
jgi:hypothetical protein